jgi:polyphosphate glucokinase
MKILVIDVGGTHVKVLATGQTERRELDSGRKMTAEKMVCEVRELVSDWDYDVISIGCPSFVFRGRAVCEPANIGGGWVGFDFERAFERPVRLINDAAMQALGSYEGGSMLFLGLGTGLGSAMVIDGVLEPMELAHLTYQNGKSFEDHIGLRGLKRLGKKKWRAFVAEITESLRNSLQAEYVVLGGGNARLLNEFPAGVRLGNNNNAFKGGYRLWELDSLPHFSLDGQEADASNALQAM